MVEGLAIASVISIVMIVLLTYVVTTGYLIAPAPEGSALAWTVAECLAAKNATVYVSKYCSHCADQKAMFGNAFTLLNSTDCIDFPEACRVAGVVSLPTWDINDTRYEGTQTLEQLMERAGCNIDI